MFVRKVIALGAIAALGLIPQASAGSNQRVETLEYNGFSFVDLEGRITLFGCVGVADQPCVAGTPTPRAEKRERTLQLEVVDDSGVEVKARLLHRKTDITFCGAMDEPVRINPRKAMNLYIYANGCGTPSAPPTTGTITATFRR